ncbi:MAG: hypothetical protein F6J97_10955 [Leptolyngbya sp. SIO4C1]|nr:hypothetical protein [Leptolyngbya sp. SIO4C1]
MQSTKELKSYLQRPSTDLLAQRSRLKPQRSVLKPAVSSGSDMMSLVYPDGRVTQVAFAQGLSC